MCLYACKSFLEVHIQKYTNLSVLLKKYFFKEHLNTFYMTCISVFEFLVPEIYSKAFYRNQIHELGGKIWEKK